MSIARHVHSHTLGGLAVSFGLRHVHSHAFGGLAVSFGLRHVHSHAFAVFAGGAHGHARGHAGHGVAFGGRVAGVLGVLGRDLEDLVADVARHPQIARPGQEPLGSVKFDRRARGLLERRRR
jgi:hypothetical protein